MFWSQDLCQTDIHHKLHAASSWVGCRCPSALCSPSPPIHVQSHRKTCFLWTGSWTGTVVLSSPSSLRSWCVESWLDVLSPTVAPAACPESTPMHTMRTTHFSWSGEIQRDFFSAWFLHPVYSSLYCCHFHQHCDPHDNGSVTHGGILIISSQRRHFQATGVWLNTLSSCSSPPPS